LKKNTEIGGDFLNRKDTIHELLNKAADELLAFIKETECEFPGGWIPSATIKNRLGLNMMMVPQSNKEQKENGWVFGALARILEDKSLVEYKKEENGRSFYRAL
jgi:hypothetical protein